MNFKRKSKYTVLAVLAFAFAVTSDYPVWAGEVRINKELKTGISSPVYYTVQKGDCLWSIAREFKVDVILLADANGRNLNSTLSENENLVIPAGKEIIYKVKRGNTLWAIAGKFHPAKESQPHKESTHVEADIPRIRFRPVTGTISSRFG